MIETKDLNNDSSEILVHTKRFKKHKTERERFTEAKVLYSQGHLVNPLGKPNVYGHKLVPDRARPIPEFGPITLAQLWKGYKSIFEERFGESTILDEYPGVTRESVGMFFDQLSQRFINICNHKPEYREMYDYLCWFHEPSRMKFLIGKKRQFIHPKHLLGSVYIKMFFDDSKKKAILKAPKIERRHVTDEKIKHLDWAFTHIRKHMSKKDYVGLAEDLHDFGFVVFGEYFYENEGLGSTEIKDRIIQVMVTFAVSNSENFEMAKKYLEGVYRGTELSSIQNSSIWEDWKTECKSLTEHATEEAERQILRMKNDSGKDKRSDGVDTFNEGIRLF